MKHASLACLFLCFSTAFLLAQPNPTPQSNVHAKSQVPTGAAQADPKAQAKILDTYGKLPLSFEANHGQTDARVNFLSRTSGYTLFLTADEAVFALNGKEANTTKSTRTAHSVVGLKAGGVLRMKLRNANPAAKVSGVDELAGTSNYFIGNDPKRWRTAVPTYAKVKYEGIYSGIDLVYYGNRSDGNAGQLEYDFIVAPGADPRRIAFDVSGAKRIRRDERGELVFKVGDDEVCWHKPVVYQEKDGARREIAAHYAITAANRVTFELARYDASQPLYIDPLIYSTYLGGNYFDQGYGIAIDSAGNAYVTGGTASINFPTTPGAFQTMLGGEGDAFVAKLNPTGSALVYSTYLGGSAGDAGSGIAVDSLGNAYVTGSTGSTNFPVTLGAFQAAFGGGGWDAFVTKLSPTGSALVYSTYLGGSGSDSGFGIALDTSTNAYITGTTASGDFPIMNPFQPANGGDYDAFVTELNPTGSALVYSTYLGGIYSDQSNGIALDGSGNAYVSGSTSSTNFPVTPGAFQTTCSGTNCPPFSDAFVTKINPGGSALVYSTYLGGANQDSGSAIAVDSHGNAYVTGLTFSNDFPVTRGAFQMYCGGGFYNCLQYSDAFVTELNPTGSALVYSTYLGGSGFDSGSGIALDSSGNAYVVGSTSSADFPVMNPLQPAKGGNWNAFLTKVNPAGSALDYSTYLGGNQNDYSYGITIDSVGNAYATGTTRSPDFPTANPFQPALGGSSNAFVAKIRPEQSRVTLFPLHLDFGNQPINITSSPRVSTLTNTGEDTLTITSVSIIGANSGDFAQTNDCGTSVPPHTSCSLTVTFTPPVIGNRSATVSIADSDPDSPQSLSLTGIGVLDTTTTLKSSLNPSHPKKPVTFTATVSSPQGGTPTGYVSFLDGAQVLAYTALSGGTAAFTITKLPLGLNVMTALYGGDSNYGFSKSAPVNQYVLELTTASLTSAPNPSTYGQAVTFTAVVTSHRGTPPDGETVTFKHGKAVLGTGTLSGGSATFITSTLKVGTNSITAVYAGDSNFAGSTSRPLKQVVTRAVE